MAYNILGIHPGHNGSAALVSDGKLVYYLEEERLSKYKRDGNPFRVMIDICSKYKINELVIGGTNENSEHNKLPWNKESPYISLIRKYYPNLKVIACMSVCLQHWKESLSVCLSEADLFLLFVVEVLES